jgi:dTDP-4-dehydrorhamnose 3,5-epimerase
MPIDRLIIGVEDQRKMKITPTRIKDVLLIEPIVHGDARGFFIETYHQQKFSEQGMTADFVQDNHSGSSKVTLRGLHYQIRQAQGKLVRVAIGEIFDVAVDIRKSSPTFGQWVGEILSAENKRQLWVPEGFAHGFYVISEWAEVLYKATDFYAREWERAIRWDDPQIGIVWPLVGEVVPQLSERDSQAGYLNNAELFD